MCWNCDIKAGNRLHMCPFSSRGRPKRKMIFPFRAYFCSIFRLRVAMAGTSRNDRFKSSTSVHPFNNLPSSSLAKEMLEPDLWNALTRSLVLLVAPRPQICCPSSLPLRRFSSSEESPKSHVTGLLLLLSALVGLCAGLPLDLQSIA